jgi:glycosyltransferase involved in cell wall biosynthesis
MKRLIRVAMIIQDYHPLVGGAERQLAALAPLLRKQNVEISVLTRCYSGLLPYQLIDDVPVHRLPIAKFKPLASLMFTLTALPLLKRLQPDLIHAHGLFSPTTTAVAAKRWLRVPVMAKLLRGGELGDLDRLKRKPLGLRRIRSFRHQVDAFVVICI